MFICSENKRKEIQGKEMDRTWGMEQTKQHHIHIYREERFANLYTVMKE